MALFYSKGIWCTDHSMSNEQDQEGSAQTTDTKILIFLYSGETIP